MKLEGKRAMVLATNNRHKIVEIKSILKRANLKIRLLTLDDFPKRRPVVENKKTIEGNAIKKAVEVARNTNTFALADDTGLFIDALKGNPGVFSARFAGPGCSFEDNNRKVLRLLRGKPPSKRKATFKCVAALATPQGKVFLAKGHIRGRITEEIRGKNGFGYDPIFLPNKYESTFSQLSSKIKNEISHRALAFGQVPRLLKKALK